MLLYAVMLFVAYYIIVESFRSHYKHICAPQAAYYYIPLHSLMLYSSLIYNILLPYVTWFYLISCDIILHCIHITWHQFRLVDIILNELRCMTSSPIFHLMLKSLSDANITIQIESAPSARSALVLVCFFKIWAQGPRPGPFFIKWLCSSELKCDAFCW